MDIRKWTAGGFLVAVGIFAAVWVLGTHARAGEARVVRKGPVVAFGDSLISGVGAMAGRDFVSLLSVRTGVPIENMGVSGDTTVAGLARVGAVIERHPSVVIVLLGGNDYLQRQPADETFRNLGAIIERLQADGAAVILLGVRGGLVRDNFAGEFDALARRYGAAYVPDVLDDIIGRTGLMSDQIHPNDAGYAIIAERVYPILRAVLDTAK